MFSKQNRKGVFTTKWTAIVHIWFYGG